MVRGESNHNPWYGLCPQFRTSKVITTSKGEISKEDNQRLAMASNSLFSSVNPCQNFFWGKCSVHERERKKKKKKTIFILVCCVVQSRVTQEQPLLRHRLRGQEPSYTHVWSYLLPSTKQKATSERLIVAVFTFANMLRSWHVCIT